MSSTQIRMANLMKILIEIEWEFEWVFRWVKVAHMRLCASRVVYVWVYLRES